MDDADKMDRVCGYLRMIERTRLLRNTTEELERLVGFSVGSGNGLARKDAILRELAHIAKRLAPTATVVRAYMHGHWRPACGA